MDDEELDAFLFSPKHRKFHWEDVTSKPSPSLLPGDSETIEVDGFEVTVKRV